MPHLELIKFGITKGRTLYLSDDFDIGKPRPKWQTLEDSSGNIFMSPSAWETNNRQVRLAKIYAGVDIRLHRFTEDELHTITMQRLKR